MNKKEILGAGVGSIFSRGMQGGPAAETAASQQGSALREREAPIRNEIAQDRAPIVKRGRPRKGSVSTWDRSREFHTSIAFNADQYKDLQDIAYEQQQSLKYVVYRLIQEGMKAYGKNPAILR